MKLNNMEDEISTVFRNAYEITYKDENSESVLVASSDDLHFCGEIMLMFAKYIFNDPEKSYDDKSSILATLQIISTKDNKRMTIYKIDCAINDMIIAIEKEIMALEKEEKEDR